MRSVLSYGDNAEGFDLRMFKTSAAAWPLRTRSPSIAIAEHFGFGPSHHLEMLAQIRMVEMRARPAPSQISVRRGMTGATHLSRSQKARPNMKR